MYGLILENMAEYIKQTYGEEKWEEIRRAAAVEQPSFSTHQVYSEALIPRLAKKAIQVSFRKFIVSRNNDNVLSFIHVLDNWSIRRNKVHN